MYETILAEREALWQVKVFLGFPDGTNGKESAGQSRRCRRCRFNPWVGKFPWSGKWQPAPKLLPGKFHGQRGPWGYTDTESDTAD